MAGPLNVFVAGMEGKTSTYEVTPDTTVDDFYDTVEKKTNLEQGTLRLLFAGKQLRRQYDMAPLLRDYNIQRGSTLHAVVRLPGGDITLHVTRYDDDTGEHKVPYSMDPTALVDELLQMVASSTGIAVKCIRLATLRDGTHVTPGKPLLHFDVRDGDLLYWFKQYPDDTGLTFTSKPDVIDGDDDVAVRRCEMPCGHAVEPCTLTAYARSVIDDGMITFACPAPGCGQEWEYDRVRDLALLDEGECKFIEGQLARLAASMYFRAKIHPPCETWVERDDASNRCVMCVICSRNEHNEGPYTFCWDCMEPWCDNETHEKCESVDVKKLRLCPDKLIGDVTVPSERVCTTCGFYVEHDGGCKYIFCPTCKQSFCFVCLRSEADCKAAGLGTHYTACVGSDVAPRQTEIPTWRYVDV